MGHLHLGTLPSTRPWIEVVSLLAGGADAGQIANASVRAAESAFRKLYGDPGLEETVWLLLQLPLAAREDDFADALRDRGLRIADLPGVMGLVGAFSGAVDDRLRCGGHTDLGEMAQTAATETLAEVLGGRSRRLFGTSPEDVQAELGRLATVKQFGTFARQFFGRLAYKCLDYFLSRALPANVGPGRRFATLARQIEFADALETHCRETARYVERFAGEWASKTRYEHGEITREDAARFAHGAMMKILDSLKKGGADGH